MSNKQEKQEKLLIILYNVEDYPTRKTYPISWLQQQSYNKAITRRPYLNLKSMYFTLIEDGFAPVELKPSTFIAAL